MAQRFAARAWCPEMVEDILDYFLRNPEMTDTLSGILQWRLLEQSVRRQLDEGRDAFQFLLERGFLRRVSVTAAREDMFGLDPLRRAEAVRFLAAARRRRYAAMGRS